MGVMNMATPQPTTGTPTAAPAPNPKAPATGATIGAPEAVFKMSLPPQGTAFETLNTEGFSSVAWHHACLKLIVTALLSLIKTRSPIFKCVSVVAGSKPLPLLTNTFPRNAAIWAKLSAASTGGAITQAATAKVIKVFGQANDKIKSGSHT